MYQVTVRSGCIHNEGNGPGSVLIVEDHEVRAFRDKFTKIKKLDAAEITDASDGPPSSQEDEPDSGGPVKVSATENARVLANEHGIDLVEVEPSGPGGKIYKRDVEAMLDG